VIKTIVVPTDGSAHANKAVELAADIAAKYGARLVLLHALLRHTRAHEIAPLLEGTPLPAALTDKLQEIQDASLEAAMAASSFEGGIFFLPVPENVLKEIGAVILDKARDTARAKGVSDIVLHSVDGEPAENILAAAEHENADMIVMGSRGLGSVASLFMGSVSHKVSHLSKCTCVTVK
jgi:nucleotide-binding universal stress UspA family protein